MLKEMRMQRIKNFFHLILVRIRSLSCNDTVLFYFLNVVSKLSSVDEDQKYELSNFTTLNFST